MNDSAFDRDRDARDEISDDQREDLEQFDEPDAPAQDESASEPETETEAEDDVEGVSARFQIEVGPEDGEDELDDEVVTVSFDEWLHSIGAGTDNDTMLRYAPTANNSIDISHAHPSGLTQFLSGRRTRLSTLMRDNPAFPQATRTAEQLKAKIEELSVDRGIDVGYLATGLASWRHIEGGSTQHMSAPVMLTQIRLTQRPNKEDFDVQLTGRAKLNPALVRWFDSVYGVSLDPAEFDAAAYATAKLEPLPALELMRARSKSVRALIVEHRMLISTFADLSDTASQDVVDAQHPVINNLHRVLAGTDDASVLTETDTSYVEEVALTPVDERDPADEVLVVDLDPSQQEAVDHIAQGRSVVISSPPGTGQTQTAMAATVALASAEKRVLVVAERTSTLDDFRQRMAERELEHLVLSVDASGEEDTISNQIIAGMLAAERAKEPAVARVHETVRQRRRQLVEHVNSLHSVRDRWQCSPFQAMQALAELMARPDAPTTKVRLKRSVLDATVDRGFVAEQLRDAAGLGAFSKQAINSPWYGARLRNVQEAEDALSLAENLNDRLAVVNAKMRAATEHSQLRLGESVAEWVDQVKLLGQVRISLDRFAPDIFDRPVTDLIAATASGGWRRAHNVEMSAMTRSRLRRVAREYVRPGVSVPDLHTALIEVQEQLTAWNQWTTSKRHPQIPTGVEALTREVQELDEKLEQLQKVMAPPRSDAEELRHLPTEDLQYVLETLIEDPETLHKLPERTLVVDQLNEQGLGELMLDFQDREVTADQVAAELDAAWWQSALEAMISGDEHLAMVEGSELTRIDAEFRLADAAHLDLGAQQLKWKLAQNWAQQATTMTHASRELRALMRDGEPTADDFSEIDPELTQPLKPIWVTSPLALAELDNSVRFDSVILLDAETLALPTGLGAMSRADQVVAFGDSVSGRPRGFQVSVDPTARIIAPAESESVHSALIRVLPQVPLTVMHRGVSQKIARFLGEQLYDGKLDRMPTAEEFTGQPSNRGVEVEYLTEPGTPGYGEDGVESTTAEVNRTVDLVFDHFRDNPEQSLAVITATPLHARRVAEAIRVNLANHRWAMKFFTKGEAPHGERFVVAPMERAHGIVRDTVVFTLGYGRTSHGSVVHHFGPLSESNGIEYYATVMTRARRALKVLTCIHPEEIEPRRISGGAKFFWDLLEGLATGTGFEDAQVAEYFVSEPGTDPLTADIADQLHRRGARVTTDPKSHADLAAWNPNPVELADGSPPLDRNQPLAIFSDGSDEYRAMSVRERSRLRPAAFEKLGWRCDPVWAIEAFVDPLEVTQRFADKLGLREEQWREQA